jgi:hypothetical protein
MVVGSNLSLLLVNGGVVVHDCGFESLIFGINGGECMVEGSNLGLFGGQLWCNNHLQNPTKPHASHRGHQACYLLTYIAEINSLQIISRNHRPHT